MNMLSKKILFAEEMVNFYRIKGRKFVWRSYLSPWHVLLTELLLQKTSAAQVNNLLPSIADVIKSPDQALHIPIAELEYLLKPLGMSKIKAVRIKRIAEVIVYKNRGIIPCDEKELLSLFGIGRYIVDAFMCINCGVDRATVDGNAIKVVLRYFGLKSKYSRIRNDKEIYAFIQSIVPTNKCKEFNWGIIDFSATVCRNKPLCEQCTIRENCFFYTTTEKSIQTNVP